MCIEYILLSHQGQQFTKQFISILQRDAVLLGCLRLYKALGQKKTISKAWLTLLSPLSLILFIQESIRAPGATCGNPLRDEVTRCLVSLLCLRVMSEAQSGVPTSLPVESHGPPEHFVGRTLLNILLKDPLVSKGPTYPGDMGCTCGLTGNPGVSQWTLSPE